MEHRILGLPLDPAIKRKLVCCGFVTMGDLRNYLELNKLRMITNLDDDDLNRVIDIAKRYVPVINDSKLCCEVYSADLSTKVEMKSLSMILKEELKKLRHIVSFSSQVDALLGGGFHLGRITEIAGEAGLGKTQFVFQLCVDVQIPKCLGGLAAEAVFLDVEGTFITHRVKQIADAAVEHCRNTYDLDCDKTACAELKNFTVDNIMSRIYLFRCGDSVQLMASCHQLEQFLKSHSNVKLVIIDSIAHSLRGEDDYISRSKFLTTLRGIFHRLLVMFDVSIVITNQVTTKFEENDSYVIPALGTKWNHVPDVKVMLFKKGGKRFLHQYKSPNMPDGTVEYDVTKGGIRDPE